MVPKRIAIGLFFAAFVLSTLVSFLVLPAGTFLSVGTSPLTSYNKPQGQKEAGGGTAVRDEPKTEECPLNGKLSTKTQKDNWKKRRPLGIMVENHTEARPQSGLSSADVIYEAVAEGGITRFLSIFYCQDSSYVGPVRSARMYFIRLLEGYGANPLYAHVGGANTPGPANALGEIDDLGWDLYNDLSQFSVPFPNFWRDYERLPDRATEHTVYTSTSRLWEYAAGKRSLSHVDKKGVKWDEKFTPWKFKDDAGMTGRGTVDTVDFGFWNSLAAGYAVKWIYNKNTNSYVRSNGGAPHLDKNTNKPLESKNIVVVFADESPAKDGYPGGHLVYDVVGKGDALIFQNGNVTEGTWSKAKEQSNMTFADEAGKETSFVRGQIFVEILPTNNKVTY